MSFLEATKEAFLHLSQLSIQGDVPGFRPKIGLLGCPVGQIKWGDRRVTPMSTLQVKGGEPLVEFRVDIHAGVNIEKLLVV